MNFTIDDALLHNSIVVADWSLCQVLFKNEQAYAWFLLVPKRVNITEIVQLAEADQLLLMGEISRLSNCVQQHFKPDKLNVAAIGNKVSQLHVHIVGRFKTDPLWPESIWQAAYHPTPYHSKELDSLSQILGSMLE